MRSAASCGHPLQVIVAPRGALTWRLRVLIVLKRVWLFSARQIRSTAVERALKEQSKNVRARCQFETEKFLT
jgi:hypothetical protein